jgi:transposase-like protein
MPAKSPPTGTDADLNLATMAEIFGNEDKAREFLERKRWANGRPCPHCKHAETYPLVAKEGSRSPVRPGVYKCKACRMQFTVRVGTIMEESKIPLCKWLMAFHLMTSSKKGVSSHQIARECGITQKSAWFMNHRIREAMKKQPLVGMLKGIVEADESYVGGKPRKGDGKEHKRGRATKKTPVMVLVERDGNARCKPVENVTADTLKWEIAQNVSQNAIMMTDEYPSYKGLDEDGYAGHEVVNHSAGQYAKPGKHGARAHVNTAESFFALLKRGHYGIFHQLSKKHLHRYCTEFAFRWNRRKITDGERMVEAINGIEGKRLFFREPIAKEPA